MLYTGLRIKNCSCLLDTALMPTGLLDKLTDRAVADLLAYLKSS